ncbi:hypothetical protein [Metabacillus iocasae]|uniref:HTH LytTR-type domain-containing protein n=1 Tax=Priestia iocasae TaxID=2291674 RepID=A0ABS2QWQ8_9BACI|nr:hypothetical protein [Metabacillus iocasae]MBM7703914.1 hypothetical protein [Metabacillus iocasae]
MSILASQPYIIVTRSIQVTQQRYIETEQHLHLYKDKVVAHEKSFYIQHVFDMSYKPLSNDSGFLYLHTNQGVFPYQVKSSPHSFIETFRKLNV